MRRFRWLLLPLALLLAVAAFPAYFLKAPAYALIQADPLQPADCLFVLAGDYHGKRVLKAGELYRLKMAAKVFVSGQSRFYDHAEDDMAIEFARKRGMTDVPFKTIRNDAYSTDEEGAQTYDRLRAAGCRSILVVTSDFHTRRAARILRKNWPSMEIRMAASETVNFDPESWWTSREGRKTLVLEWSKTITSWFGI